MNSEKIAGIRGDAAMGKREKGIKCPACAAHKAGVCLLIVIQIYKKKTSI